MLNRINVIIALIVGAMVLNACETTPSSEDLHKEVMVFHDDAMAHMSTLYKAKKKIESKMDAADSTATESITSELQSQLKVVVSARNNMNTWMREFNTNYKDDLSETRKIEVLTEELKKVKDLSKEIDEAVELSKKL